MVSSIQTVMLYRNVTMFLLFLIIYLKPKSKPCQENSSQTRSRVILSLFLLLNITFTQYLSQIYWITFDLFNSFINSLAFSPAPPLSSRASSESSWTGRSWHSSRVPGGQSSSRGRQPPVLKQKKGTINKCFKVKKRKNEKYNHENIYILYISERIGPWTSSIISSFKELDSWRNIVNHVDSRIWFVYYSDSLYQGLMGEVQTVDDVFLQEVGLFPPHADDVSIHFLEQ